MRVPIIAGNWKMNTDIEEAITLVREMKGGLEKVESVEKVLCPPFVSLAPIRDLLAGSSIKLGAQNLYFEEKGAYTGEISPSMLSKLCQYVIIGHSERRQYFGETGQIVNRKILAALEVGLKPILCIGEKLEENEAGRATEQDVVQRLAAQAGAVHPRPEVSNGLRPADELVEAARPEHAVQSTLVLLREP